MSEKEEKGDRKQEKEEKEEDREEEKEEKEEDREGKKEEKEEEKEEKEEDREDSEDKEDSEDRYEDREDRREREREEIGSEEEERGYKEKEYTEPLELDILPQPSLPTNLDRLWYVKLPFSVDSKPFDEMNYSEPTENPNAITDAVMRWRRKEKDNQLIKETNSRIVKWSDGSMHLFIGNEPFELTIQDISKDNIYLYSRHRKFIKCESKFTNKIVMRPCNLDSRKQHKLNQRSQKHSKNTRRVKLIVTEKDPEKEKEELEKQEEAILKSQEKLNKRQSKSRRRYETEGLTKESLELEEDEEEEEEDSPKKRRRRY